MTRRRLLVQNDMVATINEALSLSSDTKNFHVKGSNGAGNNARIPWCRIYDREHSPSAKSGWYVVFLFSVDGSTGYHVVTVTNPETGEVVRQMPSPELLKIAQSLPQFNSGLVNQKA